MAFGFEHVDDEAARRLRLVADRVRIILADAGIPVSDFAAPDPPAGVVIEIDTGADTAGGVYISWQFPRAQRDELFRYLRSDQQSHPKTHYFFEIQRAMRDAIMAILNAAGLTAVRAEEYNDLAPLQVLIPGETYSEERSRQSAQNRRSARPAQQSSAHSSQRENG